MNDINMILAKKIYDILYYHGYIVSDFEELNNGELVNIVNMAKSLKDILDSQYE